MPDSEEIISEFMGDNARAAELRVMREELMVRLRAARAERLLEPDAERRAVVASQIKTLERQIEALKTEEAVSEFVEGTIQATLAKSENQAGEDDGEE
jgi:hypothetical protein